ncbi:hypothetical protein GCM10011390_30620 [Aureimonas endophytica]|uniref:Relaxasome subunit MobC n=1 Tax=Aureimonas endophytica TaxID=2027858 RepID=A0A917E6J9_9HYPH|nr:hypothetical protein [Aureimonas endophytica]GGE09417.1 hypothetical protein GCM10011390_30620 [Aureimonas endophytica]
MAEDNSKRLAIARLREREARAKVARLRRAVDTQNRRLAAERRYVVGAAMWSLAESGKADPMVAAFRRWLRQYVSRDRDRAALAGTRFDVTEADGHAS